MSTEELLAQAVDAAEAGDTARAQILLAKVVSANPESEAAWLWLGLCQPDPQRAEYCYRRVLALNPGNEEARDRLAELSPSAPKAAPAATEETPAGPTSAKKTDVEAPLAEAAAEEEEPLPVVEAGVTKESDVEPPAESPQAESAPTKATPTRPGVWQAPATSPAADALLDDLLPSEPPPSASPWPEPAEAVPTTMPNPPVEWAAPVEEEPADWTTPLRSVPAAVAPEEAPPAPREPAAVEKWLVVAIGLLLGLLCIAVPTLWLANTGRYNSLIYSAAGGDRIPTPLARGIAPTQLPAFELTPSPSPLPSRTSTPTITPVPTSTLPYDVREQSVQSDIKRAASLVSQGNCAAAIPIYDTVIAYVPEYADAYAGRAQCYFNLSRTQKSLDESRDSLMRALADLDQAISLDAQSGSFYLLRFQVDSSLAGLEEFRANREAWYQRALEDARAAYLNDNNLASAKWYPPSILLQLGRCQEAMDEFDAVLAAAGSGELPDVAIEYQRASAFLCLGQLSQALVHADAALGLQPDADIEFTRAVILYDLGRRDEALAQLNDLIKAGPENAGERYYLRALIYYEMGDLGQARADLASGFSQSQLQGSLRAYVLGRMSLDAGDRVSGIEQIRYAEATLPYGYGPLLARLQREVADLDATPLPPETPEPGTG